MYLNNSNVLSQVRSLKSLVVGQRQSFGRAMLPPETLKENPFLVFFSFQLLVVAIILWLMLLVSSLHSLLLWSHCLLLFYMYQISLCLPFIRIHVVTFIV